MKWEEMFSGKCFISDLGEEQVVQNSNNEEVLRDAVTQRGKHYHDS